MMVSEFFREHLRYFALSHLADAVLERVDGEVPDYCFRRSAQITAGMTLSQWLADRWNEGRQQPPISATEKNLLGLAALADSIPALHGHNTEQGWRWYAGLIHRATPAELVKEYQGKEATLREEALRGFSADDAAVPVFGIADFVAARRICEDAAKAEPEAQTARLLRDALLDYVGRADFYEQRVRLFREQEGRRNGKTVDAWVANTKALLEAHQYLAPAQQARRSEGQQENLEAFGEKLGLFRAQLSAEPEAAKAARLVRFRKRA